MRSPTKPKDTLSKVLPLRSVRWSFGAKDRSKHSAQTQPGELVEYLESGRRPRCTKDPIITLVSTPPQGKPQGRVSEVGQTDVGCSPSGSSLSCMDRPGSDTCDSPRVPEGQIRVCVERSVGLAPSVKARDDASLGQKFSKRTRQVQGRTLDLQSHKGTILGGHISHSAPPSRDSTLKRAKAQAGLNSRGQRDLLQTIMHPEERKGLKGEEGRSHDSLLSFLKPVFMKKDIQRTPSKGLDSCVNGHGRVGKVANGSSAKLSLSNGTLTVMALEDKKANGVPRGDIRNGKAQIVNSKAMNHNPVDIKRAHSSSNIHTKLDLTLRRCASLQKNGEVVLPPVHRSLLADKPSYATLQRTRYSTTSLGRQRPVPESCF